MRDMYTKLIIKILLVPSLLCTAYTHAYSADSLCSEYELNTSQRERAQEVSHKIRSFALTHKTETPIIISKIRKILSDRNISREKKCMFEHSFSLLHNKNTPASKKTIHERIRGFMLYPYYRDTYLQGVDEDILERYVFQKDTVQKEVFLTFDDGPYTNDLVPYLREHQIPATFFLICNRMNTQNTLPYRDSLFSMGGHTLSHANYDKLSSQEVFSDIEGCQRIFNELDIDSQIFRPAYGVINQAETEALATYGLQGYIWSIDSLDWNGKFDKKRIQKILKQVTPGDIILFHEGVDIDDFSLLIDGLREQGYSFGKIE